MAVLRRLLSHEQMKSPPSCRRARPLKALKSEGGTLVTLCSACHHVLTRVNGDMKNDAKDRRYRKPLP